MRRFLWEAMATVGRVFPAWASKHLFPRSITRATTLKSSEGTRRRGDHRAGRASRATLTPFPTLISPFYSLTCSIKIGCRISCPPRAPSPHLSPSYLPAFSLPLLLHLFFFELLSAQSRTYNLTPPSSLHPVITPVS